MLTTMRERDRLKYVLRTNGPIEERQRLCDSCRLRPEDRHGLARRESWTLESVDLRGVDISGLDLRWFTFRDVNLAQASCRGTHLPRLINCSLDDASASNVSFSRSTGCAFRGIEAPRAFWFSHHMDASFDGVFDNADLRESVVFQRMSENGQRHRPSSFCRARLDQIDAIESLFDRSSFRDASLTGARLSRAQLRGCDLRGADLTGANLAHAQLDEARIEGCTWRDTVLHERQWSELLSRGASDRDGDPLLIARVEDPGVERLGECLGQTRDGAVRWKMKHPTNDLHDDFCIGRRRGAPGCFNAVRVRGRLEFWHFCYTLGRGRPIPELVAEMAEDSVGWTIDPFSIKVVRPEPISEHELLGLTREMLAVVF